jgi:hypothetical protein
MLRLLTGNLTGYDQQHLVTYLRLLDAEERGSCRSTERRTGSGKAGLGMPFGPSCAAGRLIKLFPCPAGNMRCLLNRNCYGAELRQRLCCSFLSDLHPRHRCWLGARHRSYWCHRWSCGRRDNARAPLEPPGHLRRRRHTRAYRRTGNCRTHVARSQQTN